MIKILLGGSPCTFWSIAQKNGRETEAEGMGWELFKNYLIAKEKFKPDYFLYENNKSAAQAIKNQISHELGVDLMYINSSLVSAQNRQRFYAFNWEVDQPEDRGIVLRDILESGMNLSQNEKAYALTTRCSGAIPEDTITRHRHTMIAEPINTTDDGRKSRTLMAGYYKYGTATIITNDGFKGGTTAVAEPIRVGDLPNSEGKITQSQGRRIYSVDGKSVCISAGASGGNTDKNSSATGLYATPIGSVGNMYPKKGQNGQLFSLDSKSKTLSAGTGVKGNGVGSNNAPKVCLPYPEYDGKPVYEVKDGFITIKDKQYPIKLADGQYIIRKLTVNECCRLQTLPDDYCRAVSNTQAYKGLGNGWTAEVIIHILNGALKDVPRDEEIVVLSMYDGIGTGRYCLDKMGFTNVKYYAYEIDKYAKQVAMSNYPDIIQCGDAFDLRNPDWTIGY